MMMGILWFGSCSVACLFGFIIGRCFRGIDAICTSQELILLEKDNERRGEAVANLTQLLIEGERAMDEVDKYRAKVGEHDLYGRRSYGAAKS